MPTLLHLDASPLDTSISRELGRAFVANWKTLHPNGSVLYRDLAALPPALIDQAWVQASFTPVEARSPQQKAALAESDGLIGELESADEIVLGVPMHNFSVPAALKLWIDQIVRSGRTFRYDANGVEGLLKNKRATLLIATGGVYAQGSPMAGLNFVDPYMKAVLGFLGITDISVHTVGGVTQLSTGAIDRGALLKPALQQIRSTAA